MEETKKSPLNPFLLVFIGFVIAAVIGGIMYFVQVRQPVEASREVNGQLVYNLVGLKDAVPLKLADKFKDADGDLVADPAWPPGRSDRPARGFPFFVRWLELGRARDSAGSSRNS